jgi:hypothetical protein
MTAKPVAARVAALRVRRAALGLKRLELYAHPADHATLKALAARLHLRRAKQADDQQRKE